MKKIYGTNVDVHLKGEEEVVSGVIFDTDDEFVYVQSGPNMLVTIPKSNIKYYISNTLGQSKPAEKVPVVATEHQVVQSNAQQNFIKVYVDDQLVADVPVAGHVNLAICSEEVLKTIWGDPRVQDVLRGKVQRTLEYDIGQANIYTVQDQSVEIGAAEQNTFEMDISGSKTVNPIDMVTKLKGVGKRCRSPIVRDVKK